MCELVLQIILVCSPQKEVPPYGAALRFTNENLLTVNKKLEIALTFLLPNRTEWKLYIKIGK